MKILKKFYKYASAINVARPGLEFFAVCIECIAGMGIVIAQSSLFNDDFTDSSYLVCSLLFFSIFFIYYTTYIHKKPNLAAMLPVSAKRRTAFSFIFPAVCAAILVTVFTLFFLLLAGIVLLFQFMINGSSGIEYIFEEEFYTATGVWAEISVWLVGIAFFFMLVAAFNLLSYFKYIGIAVSVLITCVITIVTINIPADNFILSGNFYVSINLMKMPRLYMLMLFFITAAICFLSVYIVYRRFKPKSY